MPKVFLTMPNACGLRPCDRTHLENGLVPDLYNGGTYDKYPGVTGLALSHRPFHLPSASQMLASKCCYSCSFCMLEQWLVQYCPDGNNKRSSSDVWAPTAFLTSKWTGQSRRPELVMIIKKKRIYHLKDFANPADHWVYIKQSKTINNNLEFGKVMKKLLNIKIMGIKIVVGALGMVPLKRGCKNWKSKEKLRPSRPQHCQNQLEYLKEFWRPVETCCRSKFNEKKQLKLVWKACKK